MRVPADSKSLFPRHLGVLGTTGGGKSTTVSGNVAKAQHENIAQVIVDTEGEYCAINEPTQDPQMKEELKAAFTAAKKPATVEVYAANHGWCVKGGAVYNEAEAERAWTALSKLYQAQLA